MKLVGSEWKDQGQVCIDSHHSQRAPGKTLCNKPTAELGVFTLSKIIKYRSKQGQIVEQAMLYKFCRRKPSCLKKLGKT